MRTVFIIHGALGTPQDAWIPWLKGKLEEKGCNVFTPAFPTPDGQSLDTWMEEFMPHISKLDENSILVGHSLAVSFLLRVLEKLDHLVNGVFLVAGFTKLLGIPEFDEINTSFLEAPFDWDKIRENSAYFHVFHGDDDPYVPLSFGEEIAKHLDCELTVIPKGGHLSNSAGYTEFKELLEGVCERL